MARSLTVKHEEQPSASPLLTLFLVLAFGWMLVAALASGTSEATTLGTSEIHSE
jgi:hypothetical protein